MNIKRWILIFDIVIASLFFVLWLSFIIPELTHWVHGKMEKKNESGWIVKVGDYVPTIKIEINDSTTITLDNHDGVILLHFLNDNESYTKDIEYIKEEIAEEYAYNEDFKVIGIACKMNKKATNNLKENLELNYDVVADKTNRIYEKFSMDETNICRCVLIGEDSKIIKLTKTHDELKELIKKIEEVL